MPEAPEKERSNFVPKNWIFQEIFLCRHHGTKYLIYTFLGTSLLGPFLKQKHKSEIVVYGRHSYNVMNDTPYTVLVILTISKMIIQNVVQQQFSESRFFYNWLVPNPEPIAHLLVI